MPLEAELAPLGRSGFGVEVLWRREIFAFPLTYGTLGRIHLSSEDA